MRTLDPEPIINEPCECPSPEPAAANELHPVVSSTCEIAPDALPELVGLGPNQVEFLGECVIEEEGDAASPNASCDDGKWAAVIVVVVDEMDVERAR